MLRRDPSSVINTDNGQRDLILKKEPKIKSPLKLPSSNSLVPQSFDKRGEKSPKSSQKLGTPNMKLNPQQSNYSIDDNQTLVSAADSAKRQTIAQTPDKNRAQSIQPSGLLPNVSQFAKAQSSQLPQIAATKFQSMVYNRNYVLNIDNTTTNRKNQNYVSGYYQYLSDQSIIPQQEALTQNSLRRLELKSPIRSNSLHTERMKNFSVEKQRELTTMRMLNDQSLLTDLIATPESSRLQQKINLHNVSGQDVSLPALGANASIVGNLNQGIGLHARLKASKLINEVDRRKHRKDVTKQLMGMADQDSDVSEERGFKPKGTLEQPFDQLSDQKSNSQQTESYIESSIYHVLSDNYSDYLRELEEEKKLQARQTLKVRNKLIPADRLRFDADEEFARSTIITAKSNREEDGDKFSDDEEIEPERNFEKLRARIKLKSIKKFEEDEKRKKKLQEKAAAVDKTGERLTSAQKKRKKHEPIKRRRSFTECQLKFEDGLELYSAEKAGNKNHSLTDKNTIQKMEKAKRFPIPEQLLNRPSHYWLKIDSLIHNIYNYEPLILASNIPPDLKAPKNSDVSSDNFSIGEMTEDEDEESAARRRREEEERLARDASKPKPFNKQLLDMQPFKVDVLTIFPHKARDGEIPLKLLNTPKMEYMVMVYKTLATMREDVKYQFTPDQVQQIFEIYCEIFKVQIIDIKQYIVPSDNQRTKFSMKNFILNENTNKALSCTLPFIPGIYEIEFMNNQITDIMSSCLLMASFMNPSVKRFSYIGNYGRNTFKKTFHELVKEDSLKFTEINFTRSITQVELMENLTRAFSINLIKMNISCCDLSINACRVLNIFLLKQQSIKDLNLMRCKINNQGARYIVDALNRNCSIRHLNISYNDLSSSIYEFSIKFASMLTRHPTLLHADISQNGFKREECMFILLAMSMSKNFLSLHMSGNELPYYERIFIRSLISARVQFGFKDETSRQEIKMNRERYQVMQMASKEHLLPQLQQYLETFNQIEEQRQGLDFEIQDLLKELDLEKYYTKMKSVMNLEELKEGSKLKILIDKIRERQKDLNEQQEQVKAMMKMTGPEIKSRLDQVSGRGSQLLSTKIPDQSPRSNLSVEQQQFEMQQDRQRQRAELDAMKQKKERSAGEMALLFMGINQAAYELLVENPMTGYMNDIVFSRILGHDDIEQGNYWCDTVQCYICQKWEKAVISYDPRVDVSKWSQRITQINHLQKTVKHLVNQAEEAEIVMNKKLEDERAAQLKFDQLRQQAQDDEDEADESRATVNKSVFKKTLGQVKQGNIRINLKPSDLNGGDPMSQTQLTLKNIGPEALSPRFGGANGMTPMGNVSQFRSKGLGETGMSKRSRVDSTVDNGTFSKALDKTPFGQEPKLEREDTPPEKIQRPVKKDFNQENPLAPSAISIKNVQSHIFPEQFVNANDFEELYLAASNPGTPEAQSRGPVSHNIHDQYMSAKQQSRYGGQNQNNPMGIGLNFRKGPIKQPSLKDLTKNVINMNERQHLRAQSPQHSVAPSIITNIQNVGGKRLRGQPQKIQRTLFFGGMVYVIEEEVYSDSDNSSVYTSEDDFEEDKGMIKHYIAQTQDYEARMADLAEERRLALLNPKKTEKELRLEKLGIIDENKRELTHAQKEYRTKIWPKHYIPSLKDYKSEQLDLVGKDLELKIGGIKEGKRQQEDRGPAISSGPLSDHLQTYLVGSFNDWMPVKMKTKRQLTFEKLNPDEPIPKATFVLDNLIQLYANYVPPGRHYFYFVREEGTIVLSPNFDIVRFKTTNIFLNQLVVRPRVFDFDAVNIVKGGDEEEAVFMKDRSVFRDFKDDNKPYLKKCFDQDIIYTKIIRAVKGEEDVLEDIKELLFKHFVKINNIFLYYIGMSSYPTISMNDFTSWANKCNIVDGKWINLAALDRILITTNVALHGLISSAERDLNRYEFLEIIVRLANALYKESKVCESSPEAILKLLNENIFPNSKEVNGEHFRRFQCYNVKVNELLKKNETVIKKIYDSYTHSKKKFITLAECREYIRKVGVDVSEMQVGVIFAESMQTLIDTIIDQTRPNQMKYVEFIVFLCRIAYEHYRGTPYENEMMYLKLEKILPKFLLVLNLQPVFLFYEEFEYKPPVKKAKKVKVVKKKDSSDDSSDSKPESEEEEESSSEDDLGECIVLEEGKFRLAPNFVQKMEKEKAEKAERRRLRAEAAAKKAEEKAAADAAKKAKLQALLDSDDG